MVYFRINNFDGISHHFKYTKICQHDLLFWRSFFPMMYRLTVFNKNIGVLKFGFKKREKAVAGEERVGRERTKYEKEGFANNIGGLTQDEILVVCLDIVLGWRFDKPRIHEGFLNPQEDIK